MRFSIRQPLAFHTKESLFRPLFIIHAFCDAVVIAAVELGQIAVKVLFGAMLVNALHTAYEDREIAFEGVGVAVAALPFFLAVVNAFMAGL